MRRSLVARLLRRDGSERGAITRIARQLGIAVCTVSKDVAWLEKVWADAGKQSAEGRAFADALLDDMEAELRAVAR